VGAVMSQVVDFVGQTFLFPVGESKRRFPTRDEIETTLTAAVKMAVWKRHRGRPPKGMNWEDLYQEVATGTFPKLKNFMHGGRKTLFEFTYVSACWVLADIQEKDIKANPAEPPSYPLFDELDGMQMRSTE
jgi:hypothetical protein